MSSPATIFPFRTRRISAAVSVPGRGAICQSMTEQTRSPSVNWWAYLEVAHGGAGLAGHGAVAVGGVEVGHRAAEGEVVGERDAGHVPGARAPGFVVGGGDLSGIHEPSRLGPPLRPFTLSDPTPTPDSSPPAGKSP